MFLTIYIDIPQEEFQSKFPVQPRNWSGSWSSLLAQLSAHRDGIPLHLQNFFLKLCPAFLFPFVIKDFFPKVTLKQAKVHPLKVQGRGSVDPLPLTLSNTKYYEYVP